MKVNFDLIGLLDSYRLICFYGGGAKMTEHSGTIQCLITDACFVIHLRDWRSWRVIFRSYAVAVDNCAICRNDMMEKCNECQGRNDGGINEECPVAWGICNHLFHGHCITRWLNTRSVCPLDNTEWQPKLLNQWIIIQEKNHIQVYKAKSPELKRYLSWKRSVLMASQRGKFFLKVFLLCAFCAIRLAIVSNLFCRRFALYPFKMIGNRMKTFVHRTINYQNLDRGAFSWRVGRGKFFLRIFLLCAFCAIRLAIVSKSGALLCTRSKWSAIEWKRLCTAR